MILRVEQITILVVVYRNLRVGLLTDGSLDGVLSGHQVRAFSALALRRARHILLHHNLECFFYHGPCFSLNLTGFHKCRKCVTKVHTL